MRRSVSRLLLVGNDKLGKSLYHFDLPAVVTCPGRSALCERVCYATQNRFLSRMVKERLAWCHAQSKRPDFVPRMVDELYRRGVLVVRVHVAGDFYSPGYTRKWLDIARQSPQATFFAYTRSWRLARIEKVLRELAGLPNMVLWYSADTETGPPPEVPEGVRVAWLQDGEQPPEACDLLFRVRALRYQEDERVSLHVLCPHETARGRERGTTCATCQYCWSR